MNYLAKLKKYNQEHLLKFENELTELQKQQLHKQIEDLDFSYIEEIGKDVKIDGEITPIKSMKLQEVEQGQQEFEKIGINAIKNYEVGILLLAGGMGTRLGHDGPKGVYNIGKTKDVYIFQRLVENAMDAVKKAGNIYIPFFIMTSDKNHKQTVDFFEEHNYFGYDKKFVKFFQQDVAPCTDLSGKILLESKNKIATSPNGNGGWFNSLSNNMVAYEMLKKYNIKWLNVFSVDNVLQKIADPVFIGATLSGNYQIGAKVIKKVDPFEKVGVMCNRNGKPSIVEYVDVTDDMALQTDESGDRVYNYGVILNYLFNVELLYKIKDRKLPVHVVTKKVPYIDDNGILISPKEPNAHKFEIFITDIIGSADTCLPFEIAREKEFAPIKNKNGIDSVESAQILLELNNYTL